MDKVLETALTNQVQQPSPEDIIASVIADGRTAGSDGIPRVGRATRKKAHQVTQALREAGWRILR